MKSQHLCLDCGHLFNDDGIHTDGLNCPLCKGRTKVVGHAFEEEAAGITEFQSMANKLDNDGAAIPKLLAILHVACCLTSCDATRYYLERQFKIIQANKL